MLSKSLAYNDLMYLSNVSIAENITGSDKIVFLVLGHVTLCKSLKVFIFSVVGSLPSKFIIS